MTTPGPATRALLARVTPGRPRAARDVPTLARAICEVCVRELDVDGAAISLLTASAVRETLWATDATAAMLEELQFTLNEGACVQAATTGVPALVPDLGDGPDVARWPVFAAEVLERTRARALFALPLQWGVTNLGVLDLYRSTAGGLDRAQWQDALGVAELGGLLMLGIHTGSGREPGDDTGHRDWNELSQGNHLVVHQATGMVLVQLGVSSVEALARLRAHAYAQDRLLVEVARDVVARKLSFDEDDGSGTVVDRGAGSDAVEDGSAGDREDGGTKG